MDNIIRIENEIRNQWFKNHTATVKQEGDMTVLEWRNPKEYYYYVKYIFDKNMIYISGDVGFAIFRLTCNGSPYANWNETYLGYFLEKLAAFSDDRYDWNEKLALERLQERKKKLIEEEIEFDKDEMYDLFNDLKNCENKNEWVSLVNDKYNEFITDVDQDYWEWMYGIGDETPARLRSYLIGLQMAAEQLAAEQSDEKLKAV